MVRAPLRSRLVPMGFTNDLGTNGLPIYKYILVPMVWASLRSRLVYSLNFFTLSVCSRCVCVYIYSMHTRARAHTHTHIHSHTNLTVRVRRYGSPKRRSMRCILHSRMNDVSDMWFLNDLTYRCFMIYKLAGAAVSQ